MRLIFLWINAWICLTGVFTHSYGQSFKAGASVRVITPDPLLPVSGGMGIPKQATEKKGDLFVRALVVENNGVRVAFVGIDNLGWPAALGDRSRKLVKGIPPENILIGATHTHSAPDAYGFPDESGKSSVDLKYLDWCVNRVAEAINDAVGNLRPATLKVAVGEAKGRIAYNYYAEKLYDPRCGVIQVLSADDNKKVIATMVNYAVHPETLGSKRGILSPDLCGPLYERIEQQTGGTAIFMNGALGGMVTADNRGDGKSEPDMWQECIRIGRLLADEALRIVKDAPVIANPQVSNLAERLTLPVDNEAMRMVLKSSPVSLMTNDADKVSTQVNLISLGPAKLLTIPGEALPNIGYYLKRNMQTDFPFLLGLTNDAFGYIMTREDFQSFQTYNYISRTTLGENTYDLYRDLVFNKLLKRK